MKEWDGMGMGGLMVGGLQGATDEISLNFLWRVTALIDAFW